MKSFYLCLFIVLFCSCDNRRTSPTASHDGVTGHGVPADIFELVYDGPRGFTLDYLPKEAIQLSGIRDCEVIEQHDSLKRVAKNVRFDNKGNIISEQNHHFSLWFTGTFQGLYNYKYDSAGRLIEKKGFDYQGSRDTVMTMWTYNGEGLLQSRDHYEYSRKLKPGADRHLPSPNSYEPHRTWHQTCGYKYLWEQDSLIVLSFMDGKQINRESNYLFFDDLGRLKSIRKYWSYKLAETTTYEFKNSSISGRSERENDDGTIWAYRSMAVLDNKGRQVEKIVFNDDGSERAKISVAYNQDGTISEIRHAKTIQKFFYRRFSL
jgi:hypothetical protein